VGNTLTVNGSGNALVVANNAVVSGQMRASSGLIDNSLQVHGNLIVDGQLTVVATQNIVIQDPIIEIGNTHTNSAVAVDVGMVFRHPLSNVATFYDDHNDVYRICKTNNSAYDSVLTPTGTLPVVITGTLNTSGDTTVGSNLTVTNNVTASNLTINGSLSLGGSSIKIQGNSIVFG
jgi:predicted acyltransferase (DUF342 family)